MPAVPDDQSNDNAWMLPVALLILVIGALLPTLYFLFID